MRNDPDANKELTRDNFHTAGLSSRAERIAAKLNALFAPQALEVRDDSAKHKGHAGARPEGETHFHVAMRASAFAGQSRLARHRLVTDALQDEFATGLHALSLRLAAPGEG